MRDQEIIFKKIEEKRELNEKFWSRGYHLFPKVLNLYNSKIGVEVGVAFGGHSEAILELTSVCKLLGVDPYQHFEYYKDGMNIPQPEFDFLYEFTCNRLSRFGERYNPIRAKSVKAVNIINIPVDFVYIDADHSFRGCLQDIIVWFPKVKIGGIIGGHDYDSSQHPGVTIAVNDFFGWLGWKINYEGYGCWWVEKKRLSFLLNLKYSIKLFFWMVYLRITSVFDQFIFFLKKKKFELFSFSMYYFSLNIIIIGI